ncbi:hypothetical protein SVIOM74S_09953 [Streptomyces violarus]
MAGPVVGPDGPGVRMPGPGVARVGLRREARCRSCRAHCGRGRSRARPVHRRTSARPRSTAGRGAKSRAPVGRTTGTTGTAGTAGAGTACTRTTRPTGTALAARTTRAAGTTPGAPGPPWPAVAGPAVGALRGANQSLPLFSRAGFSAGVGSAAGPPSRDRSAGAPPFEPEPGPPERSEGPCRTGARTGARCGRRRAGPRGRARALGVATALPPEMSLSAIGVRMTTGGMGREPGMLIRMRVVSVVSVLGSSGPGGSTDSGFSSEPSCDGWSDGYWRDPYGGVPEGYAAPPRPWGPEDELWFHDSSRFSRLAPPPVLPPCRRPGDGSARAPPYWPPPSDTPRPGETSTRASHL